MNSKATAAALTLAIPMAAMAQTSVEEKQSQIEKALEAALSRQGISVGGLATGEYAQYEETGNAVDKAQRTTEPLAYTQVDFDIKARPNTSTTARAVFRMHLDWPNFWGSPSTPIETRWLSIDGKAMGMLYYSLGNMGVKWTPLTMWAPEVGFLYTPRLFAQQQQQAMAERFQGDNKRLLQGTQFGIRAAAPQMAIDSFNVGFLGSKLATADHSKAEQLKAAYPFQWGEFDRLAYGVNADVTFLKGMNVGLTALVDNELKTSFANQDTTEAARFNRDRAQAGSVFGVRLGAKLDKFVELPGIQAGLDVEYVSSSWAARSRNITLEDGSAAKDTVPKLTGGALSGAMNFGYTVPKVFTGKLTAGYIQNDSAFRNDLAQSATWNGGRIMNTEQLAQADGWGSYNVFDAMYHNVYRFVSEDSSNNTAKNAIEKNNYTNQVMTPEQQVRRDLNLQFVLPNGLATANRGGLNLGVDLALLEGAVDAKLGFMSLSEVKATAGADNSTKATFQVLQAGTKVRVDKFLTGTWDLPLEFTASFEQNSAKASDDFDYASSILNVGAYVGVVKRVALLAGYQSLKGDDKRVLGEGVPSLDNNHTNMGVGVEFKIQEGAYLMAMYNKMTTKFPGIADNKADFDQTATNVKLQVAF